MIAVLSADQRVGSSRRRWWFAGGLVIVLAATGGWVAARQVQSPSQTAAKALPPEPSWVTATVERRVLTQTVITRGDVVPEVSAVVGVPSSVEGDPVVTGIGVKAGDEVSEGQRLVEVSGRPVFVLGGEVPTYRSLRPGMSGADVAQLQAAMTRLGCANADVDGLFGEGTKACVGAFYANAGYAPVPSSPTDAIDLAAADQAVLVADAEVTSAQTAYQAAVSGDQGSQLLVAELELSAARRAADDAIASAAAAVVQARTDLSLEQGELDRLLSDPAANVGAIAEAEAEVSAKTAAVDAARRSGSLAVAAAEDQVRLAEARLIDAQNPDSTTEYLVLGRALQARDNAVTSRDALRAITGQSVAQGEVVFVPSLPARVRSTVTVLGPVGADGSDPTRASGSTGQLVELSVGDLIVTMRLRADERDLVRAGTVVELLDEQTNTTYPATLSTVADTATAGADGQIGYRAEIGADEPLSADLAGVNLRVTIRTASTDTATLVVPITAISSAADGTTSVSVLPPEATEPVLVAVEAGLSADGFVAIEPVETNGLSVGDRVVVGR